MRLDIKFSESKENHKVLVSISATDISIWKVGDLQELVYQAYRNYFKLRKGVDMPELNITFEKLLTDGLEGERQTG